MTTINIRPQLIACLVALLFSSLLFYLFPGIDHFVSGLFYSSGHFMDGPIFSIAKKQVLVSAVVLIICFAVYQLSIGIIRKKPLALRHGCFIIACFIIGPGIIVNTVLKSHWGRPRPVQTKLFSGHLPYQRVWLISDECKRNCSFVAGDSSVAFAFLALAFLPMSRKLRRCTVGCALGFFVFNACMRIMHGKHYFSDVVIGALLVYLTILLLYRLVYGPASRVT